MEPALNHEAYFANPKFGEDDVFPFRKQSNTLPNYRYRHRRLGGSKLQKYYHNDEYPVTRDFNQRQHINVNRFNKPMIANRLLMTPGKVKSEIDVPYLFQFEEF